MSPASLLDNLENFCFRGFRDNFAHSGTAFDRYLLELRVWRESGAFHQ